MVAFLIILVRFYFNHHILNYLFEMCRFLRSLKLDTLLFFHELNCSKYIDLFFSLCSFPFIFSSIHFFFFNLRPFSYSCSSLILVLLLWKNL
jgi:hypothetical protein